MNLQAVLQKTEKGAEEVKTRGQGLEPRLRTLLIVVNGKTIGADLIGCKSIEGLRAFIEGRRTALEGAFGARIAKFFALAKSLLENE
jgi:hypothetical protein